MIIYIAIAVFRIWLLVDAARRHVDNFWFYVIALIPFGDWAYFIVHKLPELRGNWTQKRSVRAKSFETLIYETRMTPSAANRLALGAAFYDMRRFSEAKEEFRAVQRTHANDAQARYGLALALKAEGDFKGAIAEFEALLEKQPGYDEYAAMLELIDTHKRTNEPDVALALLEQLVRSSPRTKHQLALAEHLVDMQLFPEARDVLDTALRDYEHLPKFAQRREAKFFGAVRALRRHLESG